MHELFPALSSSGLLEAGAILRVLAAIVLGAFLGLERSIAGKHAGMRTYALVSAGAALFVTIGTLASYQMSTLSWVNPLQFAASIIVGIGFIGSGLVGFNGEHRSELTTASGIWVAAGVGMACGFGFYLLAIFATLFAFLVLSVFLRVENSLRKHFGHGNEVG